VGSEERGTGVRFCDSTKKTRVWDKQGVRKGPEEGRNKAKVEQKGRRMPTSNFVGGYTRDENSRHADYS